MEENNSEPILQTNTAELKLANDSQATLPEFSQDKDSQGSEKIQTVEKLVDQKPRSPAEAFKAQEIAFHELSEKIDIALLQLDSIHKYTSLSKEKVAVANEMLIKNGRDEIIEILLNIYNSIFRSYLIALSSRQTSTPFEMLLNEFKSDLSSIGIEVIQPDPHSKIDTALMKAIGTAKPAFFNKENTVKSVEKCGFSLSDRVIQKAQVILYKKD